MENYTAKDISKIMLQTEDRIRANALRIKDTDNIRDAFSALKEHAYRKVLFKKSGGSLIQAVSELSDLNIEAGSVIKLALVWKRALVSGVYEFALDELDRKMSSDKVEGGYKAVKKARVTRSILDYATSVSSEIKMSDTANAGLPPIKSKILQSDNDALLLGVIRDQIIVHAKNAFIGAMPDLVFDHDRSSLIIPEGSLNSDNSEFYREVN